MDKDLEKEYLEDLDHYDEGMGIHSTSYGKCKERLIRLAKIDNAKPSEAIECLEEIIHEFNEPHYELNGEYSYKNELLRRCENEVSTIKQALVKAQEQEKVLEIIKKKNVVVEWFTKKRESEKYFKLEIYNAFIPVERQLTQEEFELLKRYCK